MANIARLNVILTASAKAFHGGLGLARKKLMSFSARVKRIGPKISANLGAAFRRVGIAAVGLGAAFAYMIKRTGEATDEQIKMARRLGVTYNRLKAIQLAASEAGVDTSQLNTAFEKMLDTIGAAKLGETEALRALESIGLTLEDLERIRPEQRFEAIAQAIGRIPDAGDRITAARDIFGRSGGAIVNLFENAGQKINEADGFLERLGLKLSELDTKNIETMVDMLGRASKVVVGFAEQITAKLSPVVTEVAEGFTSWIESLGGVDAIVTGAISDLADGLERVYEWTETLRAVWRELLDIWGSVRGVWNDIIPDWAKKIITFNPIRDAILGDVERHRQQIGAERENSAAIGRVYGNVAPSVGMSDSEIVNLLRQVAQNTGRNNIAYAN